LGLISSFGQTGRRRAILPARPANGHPRDRHGAASAEIASSPAAPAIRTTERVEPTNDMLVAYSLGKTYGKRQVVKDVSLNVRRGEAVGPPDRTVPGRRRCST